MTRHATLLTATLALLLCGAGSASAQRTSSVDYSQATAWMENNIRWWNSLTPRQQELTRAVGVVEERFQQATGEYFIPVTRENLDAVVRVVGARSHEVGFVLERMRSHATIGTGLRQVDRFLEQAQRDPYWYLPPHMKPRY